MDIRHKLYPYPVLSEMTDDYVDSYFRFEDVKAEKGIREIILKIKLNLSNIEIQRLIDEEKAEYVVHIECSSTCYRKIVRSSEADIKKIDSSVRELGEYVGNLPGTKKMDQMVILKFIE